MKHDDATHTAAKRRKNMIHPTTTAFLPSFLFLFLSLRSDRTRQSTYITTKTTPVQDTTVRYRTDGKGTRKKGAQKEKREMSDMQDAQQTHTFHDALVTDDALATCSTPQRPPRQSTSGSGPFVYYPESPQVTVAFVSAVASMLPPLRH